MIFAKLDVCFWRHKKFVRAGLEASCYFAAALAYLREDESTTGLLESDVMGLLHGVGEKKARMLCERLVEVDLFARHDRGYVLLGYATKNETKEQIVARRAENATRMAIWRAANGKGVRSKAGHGVTNVARTSEVSVLGSGSLSVSALSSEKEIPEASTGVRESGPIPVAAERYVGLRDELTPELLGIAEFAAVQDVDGAWLKFCGKNAGQWRHVAGSWQGFCVSWAKNERTERDRSLQRGRDSAAPLNADGLDPNSAEASERLKAKAAQEREAQVTQMLAVHGVKKAAGAT
jgi:hypothetical protein